MKIRWLFVEHDQNKIIITPIQIAPSPCSRCLEQSNPSPADPPTIPIEPFQVHISSPLQRGGTSVEGQGPPTTEAPGHS